MVHFFQDDGQLLFEREVFGHAGEAVIDVLHDFKVFLRLVVEGVDHAFELRRAAFGPGSAIVLYPQLPAQLYPIVVAGQVGCNGVDPGFQAGFSLETIERGLRFDIGIVQQVFCVVVIGGESVEVAHQIRAKRLEFSTELG